MQYDVKSSHLNSTGFCVKGRNRLKAFAATGASTAGSINFWDVLVAPTAFATSYGQSAFTVTVTSASHGLVTGNSIGIVFGPVSGVSATNGTYVVTVTNANVFTITDINSRTIVGGAGSFSAAGGRFMMSYDTAAIVTSGAPQTTSTLIPGEGILAENGIYAQMTNHLSLTIFYG